MTEHHELWKSLILLRTIKRTNKQMDRLLKRLAGCNCQMANAHIRMLHEVGEKRRRELVGRSDPNIDLAAQGKHSATFPSKATASGSCSSYIRLLLVQRPTAGGPSQNDCKRIECMADLSCRLDPEGRCCLRRINVTLARLFAGHHRFPFLFLRPSYLSRYSSAQTWFSMRLQIIS
jgi:hypothetical protein